MTPLSSPLDPNVKLRSHEGKAIADLTYYRKLVGKLNFLKNTRLDLTYGVQLLSQYMQDPREPHLHAAFHMLRYLKKDPTLGVFMSSSADFGVQAYCDSDWVHVLTQGGRLVVVLYYWMIALLAGSLRNKKQFSFPRPKQSTDPSERL